jgi:hypothetical protein
MDGRPARAAVRWYFLWPTGGNMDPITLIVAALAAGAASGLTDTASSAIKDAYAGLKALVRRKLGGGPSTDLILAEHEQAPQAWTDPLTAKLAEAGADRDDSLVAAARELMGLVDAAGARAGKYSVDARGAQGVQIGDHGVQHNVFGSPPGRS